MLELKANCLEIFNWWPQISVFVCIFISHSVSLCIVLEQTSNVFFFQPVIFSWMVTLSSSLIWQIISFNLPPNEYNCVYAWTTLGSGPAIDLQKMPILAQKKHLFRWSSFWSWRLCKQAKLSLLGYRKPARMHWKADASETSHCLVRILIQRHNWVIFLRKWARRGRTVNGNHYWAMLNEFLFTKIEKEDIGNIWFQQDCTTCHLVEADVVCPPRSCDLTPLDYYLWRAVEDKCYADKTERIDALKDNIREAIWKIQLHTIDNVLKNSTDRVGYCMVSRGSHLNEIINRKECTFK